MSFGCAKPAPSSQITEMLPPSAIITKKYGNGWVEFTLDGNKFLFGIYYKSRKGFGMLTQIIEPKACNED